MKIDCGPTWQEKYLAKKEIEKANYKLLNEWRKKFAWWPIRIGSHDCRWLEYIEIRDQWRWSNYCRRWWNDGRQYRAIEHTKSSSEGN